MHVCHAPPGLLDQAAPHPPCTPLAHDPPLPRTRAAAAADAPLSKKSRTITRMHMSNGGRGMPGRGAAPTLTTWGRPACPAATGEPLTRAPRAGAGAKGIPGGAVGAVVRGRRGGKAPRSNAALAAPARPRVKIGPPGRIQSVRAGGAHPPGGSPGPSGGQHGGNAAAAALKSARKAQVSIGERPGAKTRAGAPGPRGGARARARGGGWGHGGRQRGAGAARAWLPARIQGCAQAARAARAPPAVRCGVGRRASEGARAPTGAPARGARWRRARRAWRGMGARLGAPLKKMGEPPAPRARNRCGGGRRNERASRGPQAAPPGPPARAARPRPRARRLRLGGCLGEGREGGGGPRARGALSFGEATPEWRAARREWGRVRRAAAARTITLVHTH
ncbi:MAG: hypothetical protein J3K34DRAFT_208429 [Monoraphidium minutum]|nr:MAG: hypothetical protein J3K34DRAFT_208429 [Monoraphidium minutum]